MIDADTAFRLGLVQKICQPDKLIDDCVELCTTINRNGRLIAQHTMEFVEDKLFYGIQGWEKAFEIHREFYAHLRQSKAYDEDQRLRRAAQARVLGRILRCQDQTARGSRARQIVVNALERLDCYKDSNRSSRSNAYSASILRIPNRRNDWNYWDGWNATRFGLFSFAKYLAACCEDESEGNPRSLGEGGWKGFGEFRKDTSELCSEELHNPQRPDEIQQVCFVHPSVLAAAARFPLV